MDERLASKQAKDELFDNTLYAELARRSGGDANRDLLRSLADQEREHLLFWSEQAGMAPDDVPVPRVRLRVTLLPAGLLGPVFTIWRLERREDKTIAATRKSFGAGLFPRTRPNAFGGLWPRSRITRKGWKSAWPTIGSLTSGPRCLDSTTPWWSSAAR